jgi:hypothetical protein
VNFVWLIRSFFVCTPRIIRSQFCLKSSLLTNFLTPRISIDIPCVQESVSGPYRSLPRSYLKCILPDPPTTLYAHDGLIIETDNKVPAASLIAINDAIKI